MTSFGWKRKVPLNSSTTRSRLFDESNQINTEAEGEEEDFDWIAVAKKKKLEALEDNKALFSRLKQEGILLAESGKFWQAINQWDKALSIDASDAVLFEMKAQALMSLHEWLPSIKCSEECIKLQPTWWVGHQTLGRAQLGLGEVGMAVTSFEKALHLNPGDQELRRDDLDWAVSLLRQRQRQTSEDTSQPTDNSSSNLIKLRS